MSDLQLTADARIALLESWIGMIDDDLKALADRLDDLKAQRASLVGAPHRPSPDGFSRELAAIRDDLLKPCHASPAPDWYAPESQAESRADVMRSLAL